MRHCVLALLVVLALLPRPAHASAVENLLVNGNFEDGMRQTSMSSRVANGWEPWFRPRQPAAPSGWYREPEFGVLSSKQRHGGARAQRWFTLYGKHEAGIYQTVAVPPGATVRFSIWVFAWSSDGDRFGRSDAPYRTWVGIDPTGGTDPFASTIVWSAPNPRTDEWVQLKVAATALADRATVFVRGAPDYALKHNDVLVDDAVATVDHLPPDPTPRGAPHDQRYFPLTLHRVDDAFWAAFMAAGGEGALGKPVSRRFRLLGREVQLFEFALLALREDGTVEPLSLLAPLASGLPPILTMAVALPGDRKQYVLDGDYPFPPADPMLPLLAPGDEEALATALAARLPAEWEGLPVEFLRAYRRAGPEPESPLLASRAAFDLWGMPVSAPWRVPGRPSLVLLRCERAVLAYDAELQVGGRLPLGMMARAVLGGEAISETARAALAASPYLAQYVPGEPAARPGELPDSDLAGTFEPE